MAKTDNSRHLRKAAAPLNVRTLSAVQYGYVQYDRNDGQIITLARKILALYARVGRPGQGTNFPHFTEKYLDQDVYSMVSRKLLLWIAACCQAYLEDQAPSMEITVDPTMLHPLWANVNLAGEYHAAHNHALGECVLSGVLFVTAPPLEGSEGALVLERTLLPGVGGRFDAVYRPDEKLIISPVSGWLVLFPPFVRHYVAPHTSSEPRISIAFNVSGASVKGLKSAATSSERSAARED